MVLGVLAAVSAAGVDQSAASEDTASEDTASEDTASEDTASEDSASEDRVRAAVSAPPGGAIETLDHDGLTRRFIVSSRRGGARQPLLVLLHGGTISATRAWQRSSYPEMARREGFLLIAPFGVSDNWNDGRTVYYSRNRDTSQVDDVGFLSALVEHAIERYGVDPDRVYFTGASNGGNMSYLMACRRSDIVAAIAPMIATMQVAVAASCRPAQPVAMQLIAGTEDPFVPFEGGTTSKHAARRGIAFEARLSAPESARFWADVNGCEAPRPTALPDRDPADGSTLVRHDFAGCETGGETVFYEVRGGGHTVPTLAPPPRFGQRLRARLLGPTNRDLEAEQANWAFLSRQRRQRR